MTEYVNIVRATFRHERTVSIWFIEGIDPAEYLHTFDKYRATTEIVSLVDTSLQVTARSKTDAFQIEQAALKLQIVAGIIKPLTMREAYIRDCAYWLCDPMRLHPTLDRKIIALAAERKATYNDQRTAYLESLSESFFEGRRTGLNRFYTAIARRTEAMRDERNRRHE